MGPLHGITVVEFEGLGPGSLAGMMLAQLGADVVLLSRPQPSPVKARLLSGGAVDSIDGRKRAVPVDLKTAAGVAEALSWVERADALIEGNRPGVMERLGLGPDVCLARNPRLVYGRMTGWGQSGPLAHAAGHDLNYVALTGLLSLAARPGSEAMVPPTVVGDASGALGLAFGIVCALLEARQSGQGQVVDAAIVDVVAMLGGLVHLAQAGGQLAAGRPSMFHDSPFYEVYRCADGGSITLGALEPQFYTLLLDKLGLVDMDPATQYDSTQWRDLKVRFEALFASQPRQHWCDLLEGTDVCFAPVLGVREAADHPHIRARGSLRVVGEQVLAAVAPRFSRTDALAD